MPTCPSRRSTRAFAGWPKCWTDSRRAGADDREARSRSADPGGVRTRAGARRRPLARALARCPGGGCPRRCSRRAWRRERPRPARARSANRRTRARSSRSPPASARCWSPTAATARRCRRPSGRPPGAGGLYVRSERSSGKVKRLRNDPRLLVAPCTVRGKPLGAPLEARARVLGAEEEPLAERALAARYGLGRELFERAMDAAARGHVLPRADARCVGARALFARPSRRQAGLARWPRRPPGASASARAARRRRTPAGRSPGTGRTPSRTAGGSRTRG